MNDAEFLKWIAARIVNRYGESANTDFVIRIHRIADAIEEHSYTESVEWNHTV